MGSIEGVEARLFFKHPEGWIQALWGVKAEDVGYRPGMPLLRAGADFFRLDLESAIKLRARGGRGGKWKAISSLEVSRGGEKFVVDLSTAQLTEGGLPKPEEIVTRTLAVLGMFSGPVDLVLETPEMAFLKPKFQN